MDLFLFKALLQFVGWHRRPEGVGVGVKNLFFRGGSWNAELGKALEFRPARNAEYPARHPLGPSALTHGHRRRGGSLGPLGRLRFWLAGPGKAHSGRLGADPRRGPGEPRWEGEELGPGGSGISLDRRREVGGRGAQGRYLGSCVGSRS